MQGSDNMNFSKGGQSVRDAFFGAMLVISQIICYNYTDKLFVSEAK